MDYRQPANHLTLKCLPFDQLDASTLYDVLALRLSVFSVEQNCPYQDADGKDKIAWHVIAYQHGELAATARILMPGESYSDACSIGRIANSIDYRGQGVGHELVKFTVAECERLFPLHPIRIGAQQYLKSFYEKFGFKVCSEPFLEDGIVHVSMEKPATR